MELLGHRVDVCLMYVEEIAKLLQSGELTWVWGFWINCMPHFLPFSNMIDRIVICLGGLIAKNGCIPLALPISVPFAMLSWQWLPSTSAPLWISDWCLLWPVKCSGGNCKPVPQEAPSILCIFWSPAPAMCLAQPAGQWEPFGSRAQLSELTPSWASLQPADLLICERSHSLLVEILKLLNPQLTTGAWVSSTLRRTRWLNP